MASLVQPWAVADPRRVLGAISAVVLMMLVACQTANAASAGETTLTDGQVALLERSVRTFGQATQRQDVEAIFPFTPPKVFAEIARRNGMSQAEARQAAMAGMRRVFTLAEIEAFEMDVDGRREGMLSSGEPYALVPTVTVFTLPDGKRMRSRAQTLALFDDDRWYLVRVADDNQRQILRAAYPATASLRIPRPTTETL